MWELICRALRLRRGHWHHGRSSQVNACFYTHIYVYIIPAMPRHVSEASHNLVVSRIQFLRSWCDLASHGGRNKTSARVFVCLMKKWILKHVHILENICITNDLSHSPATQLIRMYFILHDPTDPRITRGYNRHPRITTAHLRPCQVKCLHTESNRVATVECALGFKGEV